MANKRVNLTPRQQQIRKIIRDNPNISYSQLGKLLKITPAQVENAIAAFDDIGEDHRRLILVDWSRDR